MVPLLTPSDWYPYVGIDDDATKVLVSIRSYDDEGNLEDDSCGVELSSLKNWSIQLQRGFSNE